MPAVMSADIAVIAGDGIGKDVTAEAVKVLDAVGDSVRRAGSTSSTCRGAPITTSRPASRCRPNGYDMLRRVRRDLHRRARRSARARQPARARHPARHALRARSLRQLPAGAAARRAAVPAEGPRPDGHQLRRVPREHRGRSTSASAAASRPGTDDEIAIQEEINTYKGVHRIIRHAFEFATARGLTKVCMADKSNAMTQGHALWQRVFKRSRGGVSRRSRRRTTTSTRWRCSWCRIPAQFEVIVTNNLFGDIITDLGGAFQGGLGMAASGNIHPGRTSMFEPVHGSAPPLAGKNVANPIGAISSAALMLETLGLTDEAAAIERGGRSRRARRRRRRRTSAARSGRSEVGRLRLRARRSSS